MSNGFGKGWRSSDLAGLVISGGTVLYSPRPNETKAFQPVAGGYKAEYFIEDRLESISGGHVLTSPDGESKTFDTAGRITGIANAGGTATVSVNYNLAYEVTLVKGQITGGDKWEYVFTWAGGNVTDIVYKVNDRPVLKNVYAYDSGGFLITIKTYENSASTGEDWGTVPITAVRYSYHSDSGLLRHVVPATEYQQMVNNSINPDTATEAQLNEYAETEYAATGSGSALKISRMYTHGRRYHYDFAYTTGVLTGNWFNTWYRKTEVSKPGEVVETFYLNGAGEVMLKRMQQKSGATVVKTWYPVYQEFETGGGARIVKSAGGSAIASFDESLPSLVTLVGTGAKIEEYSYNSEGLLQHVSVRNGTSGSASRLRSYTYESGHGNVRPVATETVYRNEGTTGAIVTSYAYTWHGTTNRISSRTTTFPTVSTSENGRGMTVTRIENYNAMGYLTSVVDERGTETTFQYDAVRNGMVVKVQDAGSGKLNLQSDYTLDDRGRTVRALGPEHEVAIGTTPTNLRTAEWTYYLDREGKEVSFRGYRTTGTSPSDSIVGPVTVSAPNLPPPPGFSGYRQASAFDAVYSGTGIPTASTIYAQSTWVRWKVGLYDKSSELKEEWTYFEIPTTEGQYGSQSVNYGKKLFAYDVAGRLNQTTCAGGTIDKTTFNAMGWAIAEELGTSAGLVVVEAKDHDDNGNLTKRTLPVNSFVANDRVTDYRYDWRNRLHESESSDGTWVHIDRRGYDNRDLLVEETGYHTEAVNAKRISYKTTDYNVLARPYRTSVYGVHTTTGATFNPQVSNVYYEAGGQVARDAPSGSHLFTATRHDALGRPVKVFQAYEPGGFTPGSDPASVANAVVMEQSESDWDEAGNLTGRITRLRFNTAVGNGELQKPGTVPEARASYVASYPDAIGRMIATANYGAAASATWSRPAIVPTRSDTILVNSTVYDGAGNGTEEQDPDGIKTTRTYDNADRLITLVENSDGSVPAKRTTHYEYTDDGWLRKLKCDNATTGQQVTEWIYGVSNGGGSDLNSNRLVGLKKYPDYAGGYDWEYFGYNRQQQVTAKGDQRGTLHIYQYDKEGRLTTDTATIAGSGVDATVYGVATGYSERGLPNRMLSFSSAYTIINDVVRVYNGFNQMITEYQEHSGAVNTSTSRKVQYTYQDGSSNTIRPTGMTYPDGTTILSIYNTSQADYLSRPDQVVEGLNVIANMSYLGLATEIAMIYDAASDMRLTYENGGTGDAGDKYTGLDRFGRLVQTIWENGAGKAVESTYGRNRVGGVTWRKDDKAHSLSVITQDNDYTYDGLRQVTRHDRGNLTSSGGVLGIDPATRQQRELFTFDETGNWAAYDSASPALSQTRIHNEANEIHSIANPSLVVEPVYDASGNMTVLSKPGDWTDQFDCTWDAWNRLVKVKQGSVTTASYSYDALYRRTKTTTPSETRDFYYDTQWRSIDEYTTAGVEAQYVWSPANRWTLIRRKRSVSGTLDEERFCLRDYLDPVAIIDAAATVTERYGYEAFGEVSIMDEDFVDIGTSGVDWTFLFHGEFRDPETCLYNYGYRYYHTSLGRWLSRDPLGERGGLNLYGFVFNRSLIMWDGLGLDCVDEAGRQGSFEASALSAKETRPSWVPNMPWKREYCGLICKCREQCKITPPHKGRVNGPFPRRPSFHPSGADQASYDEDGSMFEKGGAKCNPFLDVSNNKAVSCKQFGPEWSYAGHYHSHPQGSGSNFSEGDESFAAITGGAKPAYLGYVLAENPCDIIFGCKVLETDPTTLEQTTRPLPPSKPMN